MKQFGRDVDGVYVKLLCDINILCQELQSLVPQGEDRLEAFENMLSAVISHTSTKGQFILKSQLSALRDDFESFKTSLSDTSILLGKLF